MRLAHVTAFEDFGTRSLALHGIMAVALANAILVGLLVSGDLGVVSFVALVNFTAGLWVAHTVHSLGHAIGDGEYAGVVNELLDREFSDTSGGLDSGRIGRLLVLVATVTAITLLSSAAVLPGELLAVGVVAIGAIAVITAMIGFLIALGASFDAAETRRFGDAAGGTDASDGETGTDDR